MNAMNAYATLHIAVHGDYSENNFTQTLISQPCSMCSEEVLTVQACLLFRHQANMSLCQYRRSHEPVRCDSDLLLQELERLTTHTI